MVPISFVNRTKPSSFELLEKASQLSDGYFAANAAVNGVITLMTGKLLRSIMSETAYNELHSRENMVNYAPNTEGHGAAN
jgi:hypothetical protein